MLDWLIRVARGRRPAINASSHQVARQVEAMTAEMEAMDDTRLRRFARSLAYRARAGEPLEDLVVDSFAATREAARRKLGMRHYDVQLLAGEAARQRCNRRNANRRRKNTRRHTSTGGSLLWPDAEHIWQRSTTIWPAVMQIGWSRFLRCSA